MAIQQVTSSGGIGILSFLFQDDGGMDGAVPEGAGFARTLHQLLGDDAGHAAADDTLAAGLPRSADAELAQAAALPLTRALEALASDFALPAQGAAVPPETADANTDEGQEHEQPFWGLAPFADVAAALREHGAAPAESATTHTHDAANLHDAANAQHAAEANAAVTAPAASDLRPAPDAAARPTPTFGKGIQHLVELAREAEQAAAQLTQAAPLPAPVAVPASGRSAPASGKFLPQAFRSVARATPALAGTGQAQGMPKAASNDALASTGTDTGFAMVLGAAGAEALNAEPRSNQASQSPATLAQGIHGLRNDALQNPHDAPKTRATDAVLATPQFDSPHLAGTEAWFEDLGTRVEWMKDMNIETAELQLHPAELGLLEIQISTGDEATTVSFVTHNSEARELIEASMPKLRELLQNQGLQLGQSHVSQQSDGQRREQDAPAGNPAPRHDRAADEPAPQRRTVYLRDPSRIDHYV